MKRLIRLLRQSELHVLLFALGIILLNWPILSIFEGKNPSDIFTYFFVVWFLVIVMLAMISRACNSLTAQDTEDKTG